MPFFFYDRYSKVWIRRHPPRNTKPVLPNDRVLDSPPSDSTTDSVDRKEKRMG